MPKINLPAKIENMERLIDFILENIKKYNSDKKFLYQMQLASEEIIVNVINYAYPDKEGDIIIEMEINEQNKEITIKIIDWGLHFDPLQKEDPDINVEIENRNIGGLGVYMVKNIMDELKYERIEGKNILLMKKKY